MIHLFHILSILNLLDGFITFLGLKLSFITELNPIMYKIYEINPSLFLFTKIMFSVALYLFIIFKKVPKTSLVGIITIAALVPYTIVFGLHCLWIKELF